jgi:hypothetical protein
MWVSGIELLTGTTNTEAGGLSGVAYATRAYVGASWYRIDANAVYSGFWRCGLSSAAGSTYLTKWKYDDNTEITGTNYTALGAAIDGSGHTQTGVTYEATGNIEFTASQADSSPQWTTCTETTAAFAPIFASTGTASTSPVLCLFDLSGSGAAYSVTAGTLSITFGTDNTVAHTVFRVTVS